MSMPHRWLEPQKLAAPGRSATQRLRLALDRPIDPEVQQLVDMGVDLLIPVFEMTMRRVWTAGYEAKTRGELSDIAQASIALVLRHQEQPFDTEDGDALSLRGEGSRARPRARRCSRISPQASRRCRQHKRSALCPRPGPWGGDACGVRRQTRHRRR